VHLLALGLGALFFAGQTSFARRFGNKKPVLSSEALDLIGNGQDSARVNFAFLEELRELRHGILNRGRVLARVNTQASPYGCSVERKIL
jgi:hypothetical protein